MFEDGAEYFELSDMPGIGDILEDVFADCNFDSNSEDSEIIELSFASEVCKECNGEVIAGICIDCEENA